MLDGVWSWNTCESSRQNSFIHVVVLQAYWWCWMVFGHGIHVSQADRILLYTWWSSKLIVGGVVIAQSLSRVQLFATPWTTACQAPLSSTISQSLLTFVSIYSVMLPNHLILCLYFSFCLQSFPASGSFPMSWLFTSGGQSTGASASASVLPMNTQD